MKLITIRNVKYDKIKSETFYFVIFYFYILYPHCAQYNKFVTDGVDIKVDMLRPMKLLNNMFEVDLAKHCMS